MQLKREREKLRKKFRKEQEEAAALSGEPVPVARPQRTLDNTRTPDVTIVREADQEVFEDEEVDEFAAYFAKEVTPKVLITTSEKPSDGLRATVKEMLRVFPNSEYVSRKVKEQSCDLQSTDEMLNPFFFSLETRHQGHGEGSNWSRIH